VVPINEAPGETHPRDDDLRAVTERPASRPQSIAFPEPTQSSEVPAAEVHAAEVHAAEPPRRRSTVREPVPSHAEEVAPAPIFTPLLPAAEPALSSSTESESSDRPRRSGWWSKRVLGKG
jgi:ribonuclease E